MIHSVLSSVLKSVGKTYQPDPEIPASAVLGIFVKRAIWFLRGLVKLRRRVFVGAGASFRSKGKLKLGRWVTIGEGAKVDACAKNGVVIGDNVTLGAHTEISCTSHLSKLGKGLEIGARTGVGPYGFFGASGGIKIGSDVIMGQYVTFHAQDHNFTNKKKLIREQGVTEKGIEVGDDCWIGAKATILDGTKIGKHCVIAADAVVKGTFPDNVVIGGIPAKVIKKI